MCFEYCSSAYAEASHFPFQKKKITFFFPLHLNTTLGLLIKLKPISAYGDGAH